MPAMENEQLQGQPSVQGSWNWV